LGKSSVDIGNEATYPLVVGRGIFNALRGRGAAIGGIAGGVAGGTIIFAFSP
jgi:hypothetical protein